MADTGKRPRAPRGFTLVELLVVVGIVAFLAASLLVGLRRPLVQRSRRAATEALVNNIRCALGEYFTEYREYPPDGYDAEPAWGPAASGCRAVGPSGISLPTANGPALYSGSGCLVYFLCYPLANTTSVAGRTSTSTPAAYLSIKRESYSVSAWDPTFDPAISPSSPNYKTAWSCCEIVDADGFPIHYDKVRDRADPLFAVSFDARRFAGTNGIAAHSDQTYLAQLGLVGSSDDAVCSSDGDGSHTGAAAPRHSDPRSAAQPDGCFLDGPALGPRGVGFDLWAHGRSFSNARTTVR